LARGSVSRKLTATYAELKAKEALRSRIGLALGTGGARGLARIGTMQDWKTTSSPSI